MKRKAMLVMAMTALLLGGLWGWRLYSQPILPRIKLVGGGEFRVFKICYGGAGDHHFGGSPKQLVWAWNRLPAPLQRLVPAPNPGESVLVPNSDYTALSIFWAWIDPSTQKAATGPSGDVLMTTESGEQTNLGWPDPFDDEAGGGYRQIIVVEPPRNSRTLHFRVPVETEAVEFIIDNPAYNQ